MNRSQQLFIEKNGNEEADYLMVKSVSDAMIVELTKKRREGRGDWYKLHEVTNKELGTMLCGHVERGNMIAVLNLAAMIYTRSELYGDLA